MSHEPFPPELPWPRLRVDLVLWFGVGGALIAFVTYVLPDLDLIFPGESKGRLLEYRVVISGGVLVFALLVPLLSWIVRAGRVVYSRSRRYPALHAQAIADRDRFARAGKEWGAQFLKQASPRETFEISKAHHDGRHMFIALGKGGRHTHLVVGNTIAVIDQDDNRFMGQFEVTEVRSTEYYACGNPDVDPVWAGYVRSKGEVTVLPHLRAIYRPEKGQG